MLIEMKETPNAPAICKYVGIKLEGKELGKITEAMVNSIPKEELNKYKITIDFKE